jgi:hypothetical protein
MKCDYILPEYPDLPAAWKDYQGLALYRWTGDSCIWRFVYLCICVFVYLCICVFVYLHVVCREYRGRGAASPLEDEPRPCSFCLLQIVNMAQVSCTALHCTALHCTALHCTALC